MATNSMMFDKGMSASYSPTSWRRPRFFFYMLLTIFATLGLLAITGKPVSSSSYLISLPWLKQNRGRPASYKKNKERKHWRSYDECRKGRRVRKDGLIEDLWIELDDIFESDGPPDIEPSQFLASYPGLLASIMPQAKMNDQASNRKLRDYLRKRRLLVENWGGRKIILQPELFQEGWQGDNYADAEVEWHRTPFIGRPQKISGSALHNTSSGQAIDFTNYLPEDDQQSYEARIRKRSRPLPLLWDHKRDYDDGTQKRATTSSDSSGFSESDDSIKGESEALSNALESENDMEMYDYIPRHTIRVWRREILVPDRINSFKSESSPSTLTPSDQTTMDVSREDRKLQKRAREIENAKFMFESHELRTSLYRVPSPVQIKREVPSEPLTPPQDPPKEYVRGRKVLPAIHAPATQALMFGVVTTVERAKLMSELWTRWMNLPSAPPAHDESEILKQHGFIDKDGAVDETKQPSCLILLASSEKEEDIEELRWKLKQRKVDCGIRVSSVDRYEVRVLSMAKEMKQYARDIGKEIEWYIFNDDDTFWLDMRAVQRMLAKYDYKEKWFLGATTEAMNQLNTFGRMAFGGAGMLVSDPLISKMEEIWDECYDRYRWLFGGDEMVTRCAALAKGARKQTVTTEEKGLHQFDIPGDTTGIFQSGIPFINLHHYLGGSWVHLLGYGSYRDDYSQILLIKRVVEFLGGDNMFKRYIFGNGKWLYTSGYSITLFEKALKAEELKLAEHTWYEGYRLSIPDREQIHERHGPADGTKSKKVLSPGTAILTYVEADSWWEQIPSSDRIRVQVLWDGCWDVTKSGERGCLISMPPLN